MNSFDSSGSMKPDSSPGWKFPLRAVAVNEAGQLLRESLAPFGPAPLRLTGLLLLLWSASDRHRLGC
jgi:hypothetical protein